MPLGFVRQSESYYTRRAHYSQFTAEYGILTPYRLLSLMTTPSHTMPSHAVLQNQDILYIIFNCVTYANKPKKALARFARVCRAFSDPALSILWRDLDDVDVLLSIFTGYKKVEEGSVGSENNYISNDAYSEGWVRFQKYARLVRALQLRGGKVSHPSLFTHLVRRNNWMPLLPHLERLDYHMDSPFETLLYAFVSESLRHLEIRLATNMDPECPSAISLLIHNITPQIKNLEDICFRSIERRHHSLLFVRACPKLRSVQILDWRHIMYPRLLQSLSCLSDLVDLHIAAGEGEEAFPPIGGFPRLRKLHVGGQPLRIAAVLSATSLPVLRDLTLVFEGSKEPLEEYATCILVVPKFAKSLRIVYVVFERHLTPSIAQQDISLMKLVEPLLDVRDLEVVEFEHLGDPELPLSANDMHRIADAWPNLRVFRTLALYPVSGISPQALLYIAQKCPHLQTLDISYIETGIIQPPLDTWPVLSHSLRYLHLAHLEDESDLLVLAQLVDRLFPELDISTEQPRSGAEKGFYALVGVLQSTRKQEILRQSHRLIPIS